MYWGLLFLIPTLALAGIYGNDDRREARGSDIPAQWRELARSVPAIVENKMLIPRADGNFTPKGYPLTKISFCAQARFSEQQYLARCSASLIAPDLVLTAGHCVDSDLKQWCQEYSVVFDYALGEDVDVIQKKNVFACREIVYRHFAQPYGEDIAIIRLQKSVPGREAIRISKEEVKIDQPLNMIGYPFGILQKLVDDGQVLAGPNEPVSFRHNLDTFSSNSGGPIFNAEGEQVGVLVRATSPNQDYIKELKCNDWGRAKERDYAEGNSLLHLAPTFNSLGVGQM